MATLPRRPGKIIALHLNYRSRAAQRGRVPEQPSYFLKPPTSVAASGAVLERPAGTELLRFEGEIALVIGRTARRVAPGDVVEGEVDAAGHTAGRLVTTITDGTVPFGPYGALPRVDEQQRADAYGTAEPGFELTPDLKRRLESVGTATLSAQLRKRGYDAVSIDGLTSTRPGTRLTGRARTLRYLPYREDLFKEHGGGYNAQKRAIDSLGPGDVLVMEARRGRGTGTVGDLLALRAQVRGAAGI